MGPSRGRFFRRGCADKGSGRQRTVRRRARSDRERARSPGLRFRPE